MSDSTTKPIRGSMSSSKRVLVVEDERDIQDGVCRWLNASGYETQSAFDGVEGIEAARAQRPDVILLDVLMPKKSGLETLGELRMDPQTANIPVVMLSASLRDEQQTLDAGARFFVLKPYSGKTLVGAVAAALVEGR